MVSIIPDATSEEIVTTSFVPDDEERKRGKRIHPRGQMMIDARRPYINGMKRALLNYDGKSREYVDDPRDEEVVMPMARIFVEAKTAEEVKVMPQYEFVAVEDANDKGKEDILKDVNNHVMRKVKLKGKRHELIRMKNLLGVSIARVGYRRIMRDIKERVMDDMDAENLNWNIKTVPVYDDLFVDVVSPFDFVVDPGATTMDDAIDCIHFHEDHWVEFQEKYIISDTKGMYKNTDSVAPGIGITFNDSGELSVHKTDNSDRIGVWEYFNKISNNLWISDGPERLLGDHPLLYCNNISFWA